MATVDGTKNSLNRDPGKPSEWTISGTDLVKNVTVVTVRYPFTAADDAGAEYVWRGTVHHAWQGGTVAVVKLKNVKHPRPVASPPDTTDIVNLIVDAAAANIGSVEMYTE
jgi:hypothetical protein